MRPLASLLYAAVVAAVVAGCQIHSGPPREISGEDLYLRQCARCHGPDGRGIKSDPSIPDMTARLPALSDRELEHTIKMGKPPRMPGFGEQFLEPSLRTLMAYVRQLGAQPTPPPTTTPPSNAPAAETP